MTNTKKPLSNRTPWSDGDDDKYVGRFIVKSLRMAIRSGKTVGEWFDALPRNLRQEFYFASACRMVFGGRG